MVSRVGEYLKLGVNYFTVIPPDPEDLEMMRLFAEKVMPAFQQTPRGL